MIREITLHLYRFSHPDNIRPFLPFRHRFQFVISSLTPDYIKGMFDIFDHGDTPQQVFQDTFEVGSCQEINHISDILSGDTSGVENIIPFHTDEMVRCEELGGTYLDLRNVSIGDFLKNYSGKVFKSNS